jgi:hypothetical protein
MAGQAKRSILGPHRELDLPCCSRPNNEAPGSGKWLSLEKVTEGCQHPDPVTHDLRDRQHRHGQNRAGHTPHPVPEDEGYDDEHGIEREAPRQQHRGDGLSLDEVDYQIECSRHVNHQPPRRA